MGKIIQVVTTGNSKEVMERIGRHMVEKRFAACAQVSGPIKSVYWWQGKIEETTEWICTLKCTSEDYEGIEEAIKNLHPYEVPEIYAIDVEKALPAYAQWVRAETSQGQG